MNKRKFFSTVSFILAVIFCTMGISVQALRTKTATVAKKAPASLVLATTTSTKDSGLLDYLIPKFEKKCNIKVKVISVGSGEAIEMGKRGDADVLLVHSRKAENVFITGRYGINRQDVMYNEFFIVGPKNDSEVANIAGSKTAAEAMKKIADKKATFISRGDKSGTNTKELSLWPKTVKTTGQQWYMESGQGMGDTLMMAAETGAYTLVDSATWYAFMDKVNLKVLVQGEKNLLNPYGVIDVSPMKHKNVHFTEALAFTRYLISDEGQKAIASFQANGHQLFIPNYKK